MDLDMGFEYRATATIACTLNPSKGGVKTLVRKPNLFHLYSAQHVERIASFRFLHGLLSLFECTPRILLLMFEYILLGM